MEKFEYSILNWRVHEAKNFFSEKKRQGVLTKLTPEGTTEVYESELFPQVTSMKTHRVNISKVLSEISANGWRSLNEEDKYFARKVHSNEIQKDYEFFVEVLDPDIGKGQVPLLWFGKLLKFTPFGLETLEWTAPGESDIVESELNRKIAKLGQQGWRNLPGEKTIFFREIVKEVNMELIKNESDRKTNGDTKMHTDILKELAELHKSGILTSEEFKEKKEEILRRL